MKKLLCLLLVLALSVSFMVGCGNKQDPAGTNNEEAAPISEDTNNATEKTPDGTSSVTDDSQDPNADGEFYISLGDSSESIYYHTKDCSTLSGKEKQQLTWEMIKSLGFRQCETCKPPKYDGYIE